MVNAMSDSLAWCEPERLFFYCHVLTNFVNSTRAFDMNLCTANKHGKKIWY